MKLTALVRSDLPHINQPALIFGGCLDKVVDSRDPGLILAELGSKDKKLVWLENSQHVAPLDFDKDLILKEIVAFIKTLP